MTNTLFLRLEGPLQSWGERGRWSVRDTAPEPTKSAMVGLLGCALGLSQDIPLRQLSEQLSMGVRIDQPGTQLTDYHTIGGGYDSPQLLTAEGKPKKSSGSPHTEISHRHYLMDASFLVALQGDTELVERLVKAVQNPVWVIFLGRKACVPSRPVFAGIGRYDSLYKALSYHDWPNDVANRQAVIECNPTTPNAVRRRDHLVSRSRRLFQPRYTVHTTLKPTSPEVIL